MNRCPIQWLVIAIAFALIPRWGLDGSNDTSETLIPQIELHDAEGFALLKATAAREKYRGEGVAIAVIDTGIDISHPVFGGTTDPTVNTNAKVVGAINLTTNPISYDQRPNTALINDLHGTAVAGIIAGINVGDSADYIGGVAPDALIYSAKVLDNGVMVGTDIFDAWQWALDHQWDDPDNPIVVINNSLAITSLASGLCDSAIETLYPGANALIEALGEAGITIIASAGNNGSCSGMPFPACHSNVISVSAVFDEDFASSTAWRPSSYCAVNLIKDSLTCQTAQNGVEYCQYTENRLKGTPEVTVNTAPFLDFFAPSYQVTTTDYSGSNGLSANNYTNRFGQTSAAAAYASGAVALLQSAARQELDRLLTVDEVRTILADTGVPTSDTRLGSTFPLINMDAAIRAVIHMKEKGSSMLWLPIILFDD